ncbi:MAG TPA: GNAT family N-acetyltransferase [Anaerolineaceae bacterium]|nr:GNAT family N-acetyltransferase [Anaerolineaceae bacterium]
MTVLQTTKGPVQIRELFSVKEMIAAERIQKQVWGQDTIPHPKELLIPVQHEGGLVAGAFNIQMELVGLIFGFPTNYPTDLHSQLLATLEDWRGEGIGTALKWFQRDWCLEHGYKNVRWTVDPLRATNAEVNIRHLGGISSIYLQDYYGEMLGIDAGLPSDRLMVEWHLDSGRVVSRARQKPEDRGFSETQTAIVIGDNDFPNRILLDLSSPSILIRIPSNFLELVKGNLKLALKWRLQTRILFQNYSSKGYSITEFSKINYPAYLLEKRL